MDTMQNIEQLMKEVTEYREKNKLAFFVGAGVSKMSDYPSWAELVLSMATEIGYDSYKRDDKGNPSLSAEEFLKIPQMYFNSKKETAYLEKVKKLLNVKKQPNNIHKLIMKLNPYHLLTTNYDDLLEQTANMFGINYSVINADKKVAKTATQRYILKVHGDFENNNFVLKESDYLNYERDFKLMDTVMKTIMATNLIVFIGYQLNDYNIKLIMNWVQNVQGESFVEPIFIYTDPEKLRDIDVEYYKKRGLRIICAYEMCESEHDEYYKRYKAVLNKMLLYKDTPTNNTSESIIDYLYDSLIPLDEIKYLRADDFIRVFAGQSIDKINMINDNIQKPFFSILYKAYDSKSILAPEYADKIEYIMNRIRTSGIVGCYTREMTYVDTSNLRIKDNAFYSDYGKIEKGIVKYDDSIEGLYNKAYDLCVLGKLEEAYHIYIKVLEMCKDEAKWIYFFFTQINLKYVVTIIKNIESLTKGFNGIMYFGKQLELFDPDFLEEIGLSETYVDMPADIKKYSFLKRLSSPNFYSEDIVRLYEENYNIASDIAKSNITIAGAASYDKSEILMNDAVNFVYNNRLVFSVFNEHKKFVRTTMHTYLKGKAARMKIEADEARYIRDEKFEITYQEMLLLIKNFKFEELRFLTSEIDLFQFDVAAEERSKFEDYVEYTMDYYKNNFLSTIEGDKINMYILVKEEIKSMSYLALFFLKDKEVYEKYIRFFMEAMPEKELEYMKRLVILNLIKERTSEIDETIISVVDDMLVDKIQFCLENSNRILLEHWAPIVKQYSDWMGAAFPDFKSGRLTNICSGEFGLADKRFLELLSPIVTIQEIKVKSEVY